MLNILNSQKNTTATVQLRIQADWIYIQNRLIAVSRDSSYVVVTTLKSQQSNSSQCIEHLVLHICNSTQGVCVHCAALHDGFTCRQIFTRHLQSFLKIIIFTLAL